jgi:hypothetical protein
MPHPSYPPWFYDPSNHILVAWDLWDTLYKNQFDVSGSSVFAITDDIFTMGADLGVVVMARIFRYCFPVTAYFERCYLPVICCRFM